MTSSKRNDPLSRVDLRKELDIDWDSFAFDGLFEPGHPGRSDQALPPNRDKYVFLLEISRALNANRKLDELLGQALDVALSVTSMDKGFLMLREEDGRFRLRVARRIKGDVLSSEHFQVSRSIIKEVARTKRPLYIADIEKGLDQQAEADGGHRSIICFPLKVSAGTGREAGADRSRTVGLIYLEKPMSVPEFPAVDTEFIEALASQAAVAIENARLYEELESRRQELTVENVQLKRELHGRYAFDNMIGNSAAMRELYELVARVARSEVNVLLRGETGTGKELVAKTIHFNSNRAKGPFVSINCAALPEGLLESELFGIEKGVATGVHKREGKLEQAQGGCFFLDEIGEMSLGLQAKLLRVVESREVERVGGRSSIHVDVRLIAATNRNLEKAIAEKKFREDLYYRLNVVPIVLPPLRERCEDVALLVEHFLQKHGDAAGRQVQGLTRDALDLLTGADWPGNVRELENVIQRALLLADGPLIRIEDLPSELADHGPELIQRAVAEGWTSDRLVKEYAVRALERNKSNLSRTARQLGMDFKTLKKKVEEYKRDHASDPD